MDSITLETHLILWHSSPARIHQEIVENGLEIYREYIWCSMNPWMPIGFAKKFTGEFALSCIALPRTGPDRFLWAETRGHPEGDKAEKTFDHGGGYNSEVKIWTAIPSTLIQYIWTQDEVYDILSKESGGSIGYTIKPRTGIDVWIPDLTGFVGLCSALLVKDGVSQEVKLHAGLYLKSMNSLRNEASLTTPRQAAFMDILMKSVDAVGDKVAVTCCLLGDVQDLWIREFLESAENQSVPLPHVRRVCAFAALLHPADYIASCLDDGLFSGAAKVLVESLLSLKESKGADRHACTELASLGDVVTPVLVDLLLGLALSNAFSKAILYTLGMMPVKVGTPALISLLRRRRDVSSKARRTINEVLSNNLPYSEEPLLHLAKIGHWHSRRAARQILLHHGSPRAKELVQTMLVTDDTDTIIRSKMQ